MLRNLALAAALALCATAGNAAPTMPSVLLGDWCYDYAGNVNKTESYVYHRCTSGPQGSEDMTIRPFGYVSSETNLATDTSPDALTCPLNSISISQPRVYLLLFNKCHLGNEQWLIKLDDDHIEVTQTTDSACITVDYEHSPSMSLSGHITDVRKARKVGDEGRSADGRYLKLDTPISVRTQLANSCKTFTEIPIDGGIAGERAIAKWQNQHVTVTGTLNEFISALVSPPIFVDVHNDNPEILGTVLIERLPGPRPH